MSILAIKGHKTRGKEVIALLNVLGGMNEFNLFGCEQKSYYYINSVGFIDASFLSKISNSKIFTLEEFLEKYPYKIGDHVFDLKTYKNAKIYKMHWSENNNCIYYDIKYLDNHGCQRSLKDLTPYIEPDKPKAPILSNRYDYSEGKCDYVIPDDYEFDCIKEDGLRPEIILKPKKLSFPKTYLACKIQIHECFGIQQISGYKFHLIENFQKLLLCCDTYWKIAGKQIGLEKPWKPQFENCNIPHYCIFINHTGEICNDCFYGSRCLLAFPTAEMRDAFYENFKDLIESCKELL